MCGRFTLHTEKDILARRFQVDLESVTLEARYNLAPGQPILVVRSGAEGREAGLLRWGLVPDWAERPSGLPPMINARAESAATRPAYRDAFRSRRCLIPADGFYEWRGGRGERGLKTPFHVRLTEGEPFAMAGLWAAWRPPRDPGAPPLLTCTILTTDARPSLRSIHPRMPVILRPEAEAAWLGRALDGREADLAALLDPVPDERLRLHPVSFRVNGPEADDPSLIEPVPDPAPTLF